MGRQREALAIASERLSLVAQARIWCLARGLLRATALLE